ncbi:MAG TPA: sigma factor-like helix-turn-helix DNA-binding protein [Synergistaceae bacterium]|nr:sigma factor-like helix-turn-helix DNA-binding protein [Synergistaceae bacterium]HPJ26222.1 sigma factor-like helix-turn-helix DNA-binding protein [Synergistaceae bacterium]HPQ36143.1 sigma factor-like helix-turn-helix DNA-binding protein [Synergistaceae bacterium]
MTKTDSLEERMRLNRLYDLYGALLTERQRRAYEMHEWEDLSLLEISEHLQVSRQGVHDLLSRAKEKLSSFEDLLGMDKKSLHQDKLMEELSNLLEIYRKNLPQGFVQALNMLLERGGVSHV